MQALLHTILWRLLSFLRATQSESEFDQELDGHLATAVEEKIQRGMSPEEARRAARLELGGVAQLREAAHAIRIAVVERIRAGPPVRLSGSFFHVVGVNPVMGRTFGPADDDRGGGNAVIVLSDKGWRRRFNRDPVVLGRTVLVNGAPFEIIGVMPEGFRGLEVSGPDFWAPLSRLADFRPDNRGAEDNVAVEIVGRLKPGVSRQSARAQLAAWDSNQSGAGVDEGTRSMRIELLPRRGTIPQPWEAVALFTPLFFAFGLILLIGCANVANLLLARGVRVSGRLGFGSRSARRGVASFASC
jgi:hypothetical protein